PRALRFHSYVLQVDDLNGKPGNRCRGQTLSLGTPLQTEDAMTTKARSRGQPVSNDLHPLVYLTIVGLALWFVLSALWGFGADATADYLLGIVSGFIFIAVAIPVVLWLVFYRGGADDRAPSEERTEQGAQQTSSFRQWASGEFATWQDRTRGAN